MRILLDNKIYEINQWPDFEAQITVYKDTAFTVPYVRDHCL